jgi:hypothetical protein
MEPGMPDPITPASPDLAPLTADFDIVGELGTRSSVRVLLATRKALAGSRRDDDARVLIEIVPPQLAATGQAAYALATALATGMLTVAAGALYARFGATAFLAMAALCAVALPLTLSLRVTGQ